MAGFSATLSAGSKPANSLTLLAALLSVAVFPVPSTQTSPATTSTRFRLVSTDFLEALVFQTSVRSLLDCAQQCAALPSCARAVFDKETGQCQVQYCTMANGGNGSSTAKVWERVNATTPTFNVAAGKPTVMSTILSWDYSGARAVDGIFDGRCSNSNPIASPPQWWQVDLQATYRVVSVTSNNTYNPTPGLPAGSDIHVYSEDPQTNPQTPGSLCYHQDVQSDPLAIAQCYPTTAPGRFLRITTTVQTRLCEVLVTACVVSP